MTSTRSIAKSIFSNWFGLVTNLVLSFFLAPIIVNSLGDVYYGVWAVMMQFTGYLYLVDFGLRDSVIRNTAKYRARGQSKQLSTTLSVAFAIYAGITVFCLLIGVLLALNISQIADIPEQFVRDAQIVMILSGITIAQSFIFNIFSGALMGLQQYFSINVIHISLSIIRAAAILLALKFGQKIIGLSLIHLSVGVATGILYTVLASIHFRRAKLAFRLIWVKSSVFRRIARNLFGFSVYVFLNNIGQKVVFATDALVIVFFLPIAAVTPYAIAGNLVNYLKSLLAVTTMIFNPLASDLSARRRKTEIQSLLVHGSRLSLFIALPVAISYIVCGPEFIGLWMGNRYSHTSGLILLVLAVAHMIAAPSHVMTSMLYGMSKHRLLAFIRIGEAISNLLLSIILIKPLGILGVAIGTLIPHVIVAGLIIPVYSAKVVDMAPLSYYFKVWTRPALNALPFFALSYYFTTFDPSDSLFGFFFRLAILLVLYLLTGFYFVLASDERNQILGYIRRTLVTQRN